ncbi:MAG: YcjF family protein [Gemmataceae bacterium]
MNTTIDGTDPGFTGSVLFPKDSCGMAFRSLRRSWDLLRTLWDTDINPAELEAALAELRARQPAPVFWLFGKTQSGKTSIVRHLTGADDATIGTGFRPTTRTTRYYPFPTAEAPLLGFLDTRGLDEPGYDPAEDIAHCDRQAHQMIVTAKLRDLAQGTIREALEDVREVNPRRPVLLVLTCLHEVDPTAQHPQPHGTQLSEDAEQLIAEHRAQFGKLVDAVVAIDLTRPSEGYTDPNYGGEALKQKLLEMLPEAYRQSFVRLDDATGTLKELHLKHAMPVIIGYASMAASAGAMPVPFVDLVMLPAIQARMVFHLAKLYGQPMSGARFLELAGSLGLGLLARQAVREVAKLIPFVGSAAGAALAWGSTYALGRAFCLYYQEVHEGHVPDPVRLKLYYQQQLADAQKRWRG